jgi:hypothetical protein
MKMHLPHEVMEPKLAAVLMRLADETNQVIEVTDKGVVLRTEHRAPMRPRRIEDLDREDTAITAAA